MHLCILICANAAMQLKIFPLQNQQPIGGLLSPFLPFKLTCQRFDIVAPQAATTQLTRSCTDATRLTHSNEAFYGNEEFLLWQCLE